MQDPWCEYNNVVQTLGTATGWPAAAITAAQWPAGAVVQLPTAGKHQRWVNIYKGLQYSCGKAENFKKKFSVIESLPKTLIF